MIGARTEHLRQRRVALALEGQTLDQPDGEVRNLRDQCAQRLAGNMHDAAFAAATPDHRFVPRPEDIRPADEVAGVPVGERDLAARGGGVEHPDAPGLDQVDALVRRALREQRLAAIDHLALSVGEHLRLLPRGEGLEQRRRPADDILTFDKEQRPRPRGCRPDIGRNRLDRPRLRLRRLHPSPFALHPPCPFTRSDSISHASSTRSRSGEPGAAGRDAPSLRPLLRQLM